MNKIFFTSDQHFHNENIIKYENRPFKNATEMDKIMIENWNKKVDNNDIVYILGDFSFGNREFTMSLFDKLNGNKFLIRGNHDNKALQYREVYSKFGWVKDYYKLYYKGLKIILFHYPIISWDCKFHGSIHLYGHVHSHMNEVNQELMENSYNVGVDVNNYAPIEIDEILHKLNINL